MNAPRHAHKPGPLRFWLPLGVFLAIAVFFLWDEHKLHILGALLWLILLACPLMHLFMNHGGHGDHNKEHDDGQR